MALCACHACRAGADDATRACHQRIRALAAYVAPERRAFMASQLDQMRLLGRVDDGWAAEIVGVPHAEVSAHRKAEDQYAAHHQQMLAQLAGNHATHAQLQRAWNNRLDWEGSLSRQAAADLALVLNVRGRRLHFHCADTLESYLLLFEMFLAEPYRITSPASVIYDLGANIGTASLYFHALYPGIPMVCVEPVPQSLRLLKDNLEHNRVNATVVEAAVALTPGQMNLHVHPQAPSLTSAFSSPPGAGEHTQVSRVDAVGFSQLVQGTDYGLKLDIEGAEHQLVEVPEVLTAARWVVGELHAGPAIVPLERAGDFLALLQRHFHVELEGPGVFGDTVTWTFRATKTPPP